MSGKHKKLLLLALATTVMTFLLIGLGNVVTRTQSGLGCGDHWPTCNGVWIPDLTNMHVVIEFLHRVLAAFVGFFTLILTVWSWLIPDPKYARSLRNLSIGAFVLLAAQIILGGLTVKYHLPPILVIFHNGTAIAFFGTLVFLTGRIYQLNSYSSDHDREPASKSERGLLPFLNSLSIVIFTQILLGAYVRQSHSRTACPDVIPFCQGGEILPPLTKPAIIHFSHRLLGLTIAALIVYLVYRALRMGSGFVISLAIIECLLVGLQILSGLMSTWAILDAWPLVIWSTIHLVTASLIFSGVISLLVGVKPLNPAPYMQSLAADEPNV